jgi:hypothetical protein
MAVSKLRVGKALQSYGSLNSVVQELTEEDVMACLELEAASQRRASILNRLISRAARLNEVKYVANLKKLFLE